MVHFFDLKTKKYKMKSHLFFFLLLSMLVVCSCNSAKNTDSYDVLTKEQYRSIGEQIRKERINKGMTQQQLAEGVSLSQNALSLIEDGLATPIQHKIVAIEEYLGIELIIHIPASISKNKN